jgi:hypothetical protein
VVTAGIFVSEQVPSQLALKQIEEMLRNLGKTGQELLRQYFLEAE